MPRPLTGAAQNASDRAALIRRARHATPTGDPSHVAALLVEAFALSTPRQRAALERERAERVATESIDEFTALAFLREWSERRWAELDDDASHAAECDRYDGAAYDLGEDEWADLPVMGA